MKVARTKCVRYNQSKLREINNMSKYLEGLNEDQTKAVKAIDGAVQVNATAGSGKTKVLTNRVGYMLENGVKPGSILCTTFTKKASEEMKSRLASLIPPLKLAQITLGTSHSIAFRILAKEYSNINHPLKGAFNKGLLVNGSQKIFCDNIKDKLIKNRTIPMPVKEELRDIPVASLIKEISFSKNAGKNAYDWIEENKLNNMDEITLQAKGNFFLAYEEKKAEEGLMDVDDLLLNLVDLLKSNKDILDKYRKIYKYIMIDEGQDNNTLQYELARLLAYPENNIFIVGDDSQSIYGFRGSRPDEFISFTKRYKDAQLINLAINYRSKSGIVDTAQKLIKHNNSRIDSPVRANQSTDEVCVFYEDYKDSVEEACGICTEIQSLLEEGYSHKDISILTRTNAQSKDIEDVFILNGFPYVVYGSTSFYERKVVKDLCAYLRLAVNPRDNDSFKRVVNVPSRYLGKAYIAKLDNSSHEFYYDTICKGGVDMKPYEARGSEDFVGSIDKMVGMAEEGIAPTEILDYILEEVGYEKYLKDNASDDEDEEVMENVYTLKHALSKYEKIEDFLEFIDKMMSTVKQSVDGIQVLSVHKSKGLEYKVAFIIGVSEGIMPHWRSIQAVMNRSNPLAVEEERRLMYVAITRAQEKAYVSSICQYNGKDLDESRFIDEMGL